MFGKSELLRAFVSLAPPSSNTRDRIEAVLRRVAPNGGATAASAGGGGKGGGKGGNGGNGGGGGGGGGGGSGGEGATWLVGANHVFVRDDVLLSLQGALLQQTWAPLVRVQAAARRRVARKRVHQLRRERGEAKERAAFEAMVVEAQERMVREYEAEEAKEGGRKTLPVQLPSADAVYNIFELLKQLALSLSPATTATATTVAAAAAATAAAPTAAADTAGAAGAAASASQAASDESAPSVPVAATPGAHAAKLAAFRAGVGGAAPAPATAEQRPRAVPLETPRGTALIAEDGTPLTAVHGSEGQVAATHKKERKRTGKKVGRR